MSQTLAPLSQVKHIFPPANYSDPTPPQGGYFVNIENIFMPERNIAYTSAFCRFQSCVLCFTFQTVQLCTWTDL